MARINYAELIHEYGAQPKANYAGVCALYLNLSASAMIVMLVSPVLLYCFFLLLFPAFIVMLIGLIFLGLKPMVLYNAENDLSMDEVDIHRHYIRNHVLARIGWIVLALSLFASIAFWFIMFAAIASSANAGFDENYVLGVFLTLIAVTGLLIIGSLTVHGVLLSRMFRYMEMRTSVMLLIGMLVVSSLFVISVIIGIVLASQEVDIHPLVMILPPLLLGLGFWGLLLGTCINTFRAAHRFSELKRFLKTGYQSAGGVPPADSKSGAIAYPSSPIDASIPAPPSPLGRGAAASSTQDQTAEQATSLSALSESEPIDEADVYEIAEERELPDWLDNFPEDFREEWKKNNGF